VAFDVDAVIFLGDYIYEENGTDPFFPTVRTHEPPLPRTLTTIDDFRGRYAQYRSDPLLQAASAAAPWFILIDDHEIQNNWAGNNSYINDPTSGDDFRALRAVGYQVCVSCFLLSSCA
jgi:alkaline phosphatase D